jgi:hypothetical protein
MRGLRRAGPRAARAVVDYFFRWSMQGPSYCYIGSSNGSRTGSEANFDSREWI